MAQGWIVTPTDGEPYCYDPCRLDYGTLIPLGFCYQVPGVRARYSNEGGRSRMLVAQRVRPGDPSDCQNPLLDR
jgi:hypothetical protein